MSFTLNFNGMWHINSRLCEQLCCFCFCLASLSHYTLKYGNLNKKKNHCGLSQILKLSPLKELSFRSFSLHPNTSENLATNNISA